MVPMYFISIMAKATGTHRHTGLQRQSPICSFVSFNFFLHSNHFFSPCLSSHLRIGTRSNMPIVKSEIVLKVQKCIILYQKLSIVVLSLVENAKPTEPMGAIIFNNFVTFSKNNSYSLLKGNT